MVEREVWGCVASLTLGALVAGCDSSSDANAGANATTSEGGSGGAGASSGLLGGTGGAGATSSGGGHEPAVAACPAVHAAPPIVLAEPLLSPDDVMAITNARFVWSGDGIVGVWGGFTAGSHRVLRLDTEGAPRGPVQDLWPGRGSSQVSELAVAGEVLAVVDQVSVGVQGRQECVLGLAALPSLTSVLEPTRFSDPTEDESIVNEAHRCSVAATASGFVVAWEQYTSRMSSAWSLFAQRYALDGTLDGERVTLASGGDFSKIDAVSATSDGARATLAFTESSSEGTALAFIDGDGLRTESVTLEGPLRISAAHGDLIAQSSEQAWLLDVDGTTRAGPLDLPYALLGPLGTGYVSVTTEEFLVARAIDGGLAESSEPTGLSLDRVASAEQLVFAPDGSWTAVLYRDDSKLKLSLLSCSDESAAPPGPLLCPESESVPPLDDGCQDDVCHLAIRLDYQTLGLRGYTSVGGTRSPVDATGATEVTRVVFDANGSNLSPDIQVGGAHAGVFVGFVEPADFGAFALVGSESGMMIAAGGVDWMGRGDYWAPSEWRPSAEIACGEATAAPVETFLDPTACDTFGDPVVAASPEAALEVALRTNLAQHYAETGSFSAFVYLYTPTVGACDPSVAEYVVVLTRE